MNGNANTPHGARGNDEAPGPCGSRPREATEVNPPTATPPRHQQPQNHAFAAGCGGPLGLGILSFLLGRVAGALDLPESQAVPLLVLPSAVALVLGIYLILSIIRTTAAPLRRTPSVLAIVLALPVVMAGLFSAGRGTYDVTIGGRAIARRDICGSRMRKLVYAIGLCAADNHNRFPPADSWCDAVLPYVESTEVFVCPEAPDLRSGYAFNRSLSGVNRDAIADPQTAVVIYDSDAGWNAAGGPELLPEKPRHLNATNYAFAGGHAVSIPGPSAFEFQWQPILNEEAESP